MVERGEKLSFALEPDHALLVGGKGLGEDLDGQFAAQARVRGAINLAHSAGHEFFQDSVVRYGLTDHWRRIRHRAAMLGRSIVRVNASVPAVRTAGKAASLFRFPRHPPGISF